MNVPDPRIPVYAGAPDLAAGEDVVVRETLAPVAHGPGCACCAPRSALARALARLFLARARGDMALFTRVIVACAPDEAAAVAAAIAADPVSAARFRFAGWLAAQAGGDSSPSPSDRCM
jgi:hypothetical protein